MRKSFGFFCCAIVVVVLSSFSYGAWAQTSPSGLNWDTTALKLCKQLQPAARDCKNALITRPTDGISFSAPLVITKGGTYSGRYLSSDPQIPAVTIRTSEPVTLINSVVVGAGNLIYGRDINGLISNVSGFGIGNKPGKFLDATVQGSLTVQGNRMSNVWGMRISGNARQEPSQIALVNNIAYNMIDGMEGVAHFIQVGNGVFPGADIANNVAVNAPWKSHVEDVINLYDARGTQTQPITVHGNKILGAYPLHPESDGYSGGGIIVDGSKQAAAETSSAYVQISGNVVADTSNYGISIASGNNGKITNNIVFSSGLTNGGVIVKSQNVGISVWNGYQQDGSVFFNNVAYSNSVWWRKGNNQQNNWWFPECGTACANTVLWPSISLNDAVKTENLFLRQYFGLE